MCGDHSLSAGPPTLGMLNSIWESQAPRWMVTLEDTSAALGWPQPGCFLFRDHPDRELASPGVKALVAATHYLCPRLEQFGGHPPQEGSLQPLEHLPVQSISSGPQEPGTYSCPKLGHFQGQGPKDYSQNPWGSSQGSCCQRKQPSTGFLSQRIAGGG